MLVLERARRDRGDVVVVPLVDAALLDMPLLEVLPLDIPDELSFTPVVVELLPLVFGRFRSTSPPDVLVEPLRCTVPLAGTQFVVLAPFDVAVFVAVPVPFAPLVVFRPMKR